jgi:hypothetical protein
MRQPVISVPFFCCLLLQACNQPFQPDGAYDGRLAVYAILSSSSDTQYVRISRTYQTSAPGDITDAVVDVVPGNGKPTVRFRDTTVIHRDPSGQTGTYNVYVAYGFRPQPYVSYQLSATSPTAGSAHGTTVALGPVNTTLVNPSSLVSSPDSIVLSADFGSSAGAFVLQLYVEYELTLNGITSTEKVEVPRGSSFDASGNVTLQYPVFARVPRVTSGNGFATAITWFPKVLFIHTQAGIINSNPPGSVRITAVMYTMTQIDDALYSYYYILNGPKDLSTIRLDTPDFTNITNGVGVIASTQMVVHEVSLGQ